MVATGFESVSTWREELPRHCSAVRRQVVTELADRILARGAGRLRVALDGRTAAGKTTLGHEPAAAIRGAGRTTARASLDDFKHPWRHSAEHGYDRLSGAGYYRNAWDFAAARDLLLTPSGAAGSGVVALCGYDPLTGADHRSMRVALPPDTVLIVDGVFALRPEYHDCWDFAVWVEVDAAVSLRRGLERDTAQEGADGALVLHRERYQAAEEIYLAEVGPVDRVDAVVENTDVDRPRLRLS